MHYFRKIHDGLDPQPFLDEIASVPNAWSLNIGRQSKIAVQREAESIPIRGLVKSKIQGRARCDVHESRFTTLSLQFPQVREFLEAIADKQDAELGRAKVVRLKPDHRVYPHVDRGDYYRHRDRYHLILQSTQGSYLMSGGEEVRMKEGELWWFDNNQAHEAMNDGKSDRIHLIFDLLPRTRLALVYGPASDPQP